jgi:dynein heavy chain
MKVAEYYIKSMDLPDTEDLTSISSASIISSEKEEEKETRVKDRKLTVLEKKLVEMVMIFNLSIAEGSDRFYREHGRKNYVTPTSYLEMLRSFKILYKKKFLDITMQRDR